MRIAVPVAEFHRGNTSEYVLRALDSLGHETSLLTAEELYSELTEQNFDLFFCVDSGAAFSFPDGLDLSRVALWLIDYRHHWDGSSRTPGDLEVAQRISGLGGWVFQAQAEDARHAAAQGVKNVVWLPLAADPDVWANEPEEPRTFDLGFVGNVWDRARAEALQILMRSPELSFTFPGHSALWMGEGAALLRRCRAGFNISSWFGSEHAFDINMRVFETLSCGVPLITNAVPSLSEIFPANVPFVRTFHDLSDLRRSVMEALRDPAFVASGAEARRFILENATYVHRMTTALGVISEAHRTN